MSRSRTPETPSRTEVRRKKAVRTRIVLSVTAAAAAVAVGVAVADSDGDGHDRRAEASTGAKSAGAGAGDPTGTAAPAPSDPLLTADASASASALPSGTPGAGAAATGSAAPAKPTAAKTTGTPAKPAAPTSKPTRKATPTKGSGSGGTGGGSGSGGGTVNTSAESAVLALVNKERAKAGCGALTSNAKLSNAARSYSDTMARVGVMSHTGPDGSTMTSRVEAAGYKWSTLGENIARGQADADAVMKAWMNSPGHRANILNCSFKEIGIGVHKGDGGPWWTQDFGASR
ncbi:CAP domain-containing protein [Streptomyces sp. NPDC089799]|uniref:CAP domain-containing protein n=1 Tax=Streptomyces sp. NPDC089799 TaxID=3155066 RepID=UPI00343177C6